MDNHLSLLPLSLLSPPPSPPLPLLLSHTRRTHDPHRQLCPSGGGGFSPNPRNEEKREGFKCDRTKYDETVKVEE